MGSAGGERLTPVVVAYNAGASQAIVTGRLTYAASDGSTLEVALPAIRVRAGETKAIEVAGTLRAAGVPADVSGAGLEFEYSTEPGSVQMTALSVGDRGNQVFRVPLWDVPAQRSGTGGYPWYIDGSSSTFVYVKNVTDVPQDYTFQLNFAGGVYSLGLKTVKPHQTITFDIRALRDQQVPDEQGVTIPLTATRGQIMWSVQGPDGLAIIGRSEQVDEVTGVSSNYACQSCCPNSMDSVWVTSESSAIGVGDSTIDTAFQQNRNCYGQLMAPFTVNNANWSSSDNSVASVAGGQVDGQGPGGAGIQASWTAYTYYHAGTCNTVTIPVGPSGPIDVCSKPTGETTSPSGWADSLGYYTIGKWTQTLTPSFVSFSGRTVREFNSGTGTDDCWFLGSNIDKADQVTPIDPWTVNSNNSWGPDLVGWRPNAVNTYRAAGRAPCSFSVTQRMAIYCGDFSTLTYKFNTLGGTIGTTTVTSTRDGQTATRGL